MQDLLGQVEAGQEIAEPFAGARVAKSTLDRWHAIYGGLTRDDAKRPRQLDVEHRRLKKLVADPSLDTLELFIPEGSVLEDG